MFIGSLFSGIGGLELGLERAGLGPVMWQVEQDAFCRQVLAKRWPSANRSVTDVREAGPHNLDHVGIICGGFPCQDVSGAGLGAGLAGSRSGLWYEFRRIVRDIQPRFVVVENVASGASRWLCEVRSGLQTLGYRTRALGIAARDVGAPHRRERIFIVAYADGVRGVQQEGTEPEQRGWSADGGAARGGRDVGDACGARREGSIVPRAEGDRRVSPWSSRWLRSDEPGVAGGSHGLPAGLDGGRWPAPRGQEQHAWEPPRTVGYFVPKRRDRVRSLGNAVVPQCAEIVGRVIQQIRGVFP